MQGTNKVSLRAKWVAAGSITSETSALAVTGRDVTTVDALAATKTVKLLPPTPGPYAVLLRFRADGSADVDSDLEMYAARGGGGEGDGHYSRVATLDVITGTQDTGTSTIHFIDEINPTNEDLVYDGEESIATGDNHIATYYCRTLGNDRFIFIASDLDSTTVYIDACWLYE